MNALEKDMRAWLLDCFSEEEEQERIENLSYEKLCKAIEKYFEGGMSAFLSTGFVRARGKNE